MYQPVNELAGGLDTNQLPDLGWGLPRQMRSGPLMMRKRAYQIKISVPGLFIKRASVPCVPSLMESTYKLFAFGLANHISWHLIKLPQRRHGRPPAIMGHSSPQPPWKNLHPSFHHFAHVKCSPGRHRPAPFQTNLKHGPENATEPNQRLSHNGLESHTVPPTG